MEKTTISSHIFSIVLLIYQTNSSACPRVPPSTHPLHLCRDPAGDFLQRNPGTKMKQCSMVIEQLHWDAYPNDILWHMIIHDEYDFDPASFSCSMGFHPFFFVDDLWDFMDCPWRPPTIAASHLLHTPYSHGMPWISSECSCVVMEQFSNDI